MSNYIPRDDHQPGYVYLIGAKGSPNLYKIGLTRNPERRLTQLNSSQSPYHLEFLKLIEVEDMLAAETHLHRQFAAYATKKNEWFCFAPNDLNQVITAMDGLTFLQRPSASQFPGFVFFRNWIIEKPIAERIGLGIAICGVVLIGISAVSGNKLIARSASKLESQTANRCETTAPLLNVRSGPGINYAISGEPLKQKTLISNLQDSQGWIKSEYGWLAANHVKCQ